MPKHLTDRQTTCEAWVYFRLLLEQRLEVLQGAIRNVAKDLGWSGKWRGGAYTGNILSIPDRM